MFDIRIDTSSLTYTQFFIPELASMLVEGAGEPTIGLEPGTYGFQQISGSLADCRFTVTPSGLIDYEATHEGFLEGRGTTTLIVRGFTVLLDATALSHDLLPLVIGATPLSQDLTHQLTLVPAAGYSFQPASGIVGDFAFGVDANGQVVIDPRYGGFATAAGSTVTINGYQITIDGRQLSHDLLPASMLGTVEVMSREQTNEFTYIPGAGYSFQPASGIVADFAFGVDVDGQIVIDPCYAGFATATDHTLTISGYQITIDGRELSHDLLPVGMVGGAEVLSRAQTNAYTSIPATGYGFQPASGIVADFAFGVDVDGQIVIDPRHAGFATAAGNTLAISGYQITIDGRGLSHDLLPLLLGWSGEPLSHVASQGLTLIPGAGYSFQPASGIVADFALAVDVEGQLVIDPRYAGFTTVNGRLLTLSGYQVTIDGRSLATDLVPLLLGWGGGLLAHTATTMLTLVPAADYMLQTVDGSGLFFAVTLTTDGTTAVLPDGKIFVNALSHPSDGRFCSVPDDAGLLHPLTFGSPGGRWSRAALRVAINTAGCSFVNAPGAGLTPQGLIINAFRRWQVASAFFTFTFVPAGQPADIRVVFGGNTVDARFGTSGGALASGGYPEQGNVQFDTAETWSNGSVGGTSNLLAVAVHEIGHALGLSHSNRPNGTMYPFQTPATVVDADAQNALRLLYGWAPQQRLSDRGTTDRPTMGTTSWSNFTTRVVIPRMVWTGVRGDSGIYESELLSMGWTPQRRVPDIGSSHSPALATISAPGPTPNTGLLMAWKGVSDDSGLYWSRDVGAGWEPQQRISGVGSSTRPALAMAGGQIRMAWKGIGGDSGIYWSTFDGAGSWSVQARVNGVGTSDSPAIVGIGNRLYMFWKGIAGDSSAYWSMLDFANDPIWRPQRRIEYFSYEVGGGVALAIGTTGALSATPRGNGILLAWKGVQGDSGIYVSLFADDEFGGQIGVPNVGTAVGPAVVDVEGRTLMAWQGIAGDSTIYWSQL